MARHTFNVKPEHARAIGMAIYNLEHNKRYSFTTEEDEILNVYLEDMNVACSYRTGLITVYDYTGDDDDWDESQYDGMESGDMTPEELAAYQKGL